MTSEEVTPLAPKDPVQLFNKLMEDNNLILVPVQPKIEYTSGGGAIITPSFSVSFRDK